MFLLSLCLLLATVGANFVPPKPSTIYHNQKVDHFSPTDTRTFKQKVLIYEDYYHKSSAKNRPIFFTPGGEAPVIGGYMHNGFMFEMGKSIGALMLFPEHRYYGDSYPFGPYSQTPLNITFLNVEQALADYVAIIEQTRRDYGMPKDTVVVAFGGSYPGMLAAYLRVAFPNVVDMALASSAPIGFPVSLSPSWQPQDEPSHGFWRVATQDFAEYDAQCPDVVRTAFANLDALYSQGAFGVRRIGERLRLCPLPNPNQFYPQATLTNWIRIAFATLGMENYPYSTGEFGAWPARTACRAAMSDVRQGKWPLEALASAISVVYNATGSQSCYTISDLVNCADVTGCGDGADGVSWFYQSCTQIFNAISANNRTDMFPPQTYSLKSLQNLCDNRFRRPGFDPDYLPKKYNYTSATKIIFSNGLDDPWEPLGVLESPNPGTIVSLQYALGAHHLDLRGSSPQDPTSVRQIRQLESKILTRWMKDARLERQNRI